MSLYIKFVILSLHYPLHNLVLSNLVLHQGVLDLIPKLVACSIFIIALYFVREFVGSHLGGSIGNVFQTGKPKHLGLEKACTDSRTSI